MEIRLFARFIWWGLKVKITPGNDTILSRLHVMTPFFDISELISAHIARYFMFSIRLDDIKADTFNGTSTRCD